MYALPLLLGFLIAQRLGELVLARRNTARLKADGAIEVGARHYPLFVALHAGWIIAMAALIPWATAPNMVLVGAFLILQVIRIWVMVTLGRYWTTRIITVPGAPLVRTGPFRLVRHPNYLVVIGEIAILPLAFSAWEIAAIFTLLNLSLLLHRIRVEEAALEERR